MVRKFEPSEVKAKSIKVNWEDLAEASDYQVYWDRGDNQPDSAFFPLTKSTQGKSEYTLNESNSAGIIGTAEFAREGGTFNFKISYTDKKTNQQSKLSTPPFQVVVKVKTKTAVTKGTKVVVNKP